MDSLPPWSLVQSLLLKVVLPGFGSGAGVLAAACAITRSKGGRLLGGALALAGGLALGNVTRGLLPWWSLETGWPSLFPATMACILGGVLVALAATPSVALPGAPDIARQGGGTSSWPGHAWRCNWVPVWRLITMVFCAWWLTPAAAPVSRLGGVAALAAAGALHGEAFRRGTRSGPGGGVMLAIVIPWGLAAAAVLIHAASARFFDVAVLLTAALAGVGVIAMWRKLDVAALFAVAGLALPALMLAGATNNFSEVPAASFGLVALAPGALWSLCLPPMAGWPGRARAIAAMVCVTIPCAIAIILAMRAEPLDFNQ